MERWKKIDGYPNYAVSNLGNIKNIKRNKLLKPQMIWSGYTHIHLCNNGHIKQYSIHRIVAMAWIPNPNNKPDINHIDFNRSNNNVKNLEWCTESENIQHCIKHNRYSKREPVRGVQHGKSIFDDMQVKTIKVCLRDGMLKNQLAKYFNCSFSAIEDIETGVTWRHVTIDDVKLPTANGYFKTKYKHKPSYSFEFMQKIKNWYSKGKTQVQLSKKYMVSQSTVSKIVMGKL